MSQRRVSRQRSRQSIDSQNSDTVYLDSNLEITSSNFFNESDDEESLDDFQVFGGFSVKVISFNLILVFSVEYGIFGEGSQKITN